MALEPDLRHVCFEGVPAGRRLTSRFALPASAELPTTESVRPHEGCELPVTILRHAGLDPLVYRTRPLQRRVGACLRVLHATRQEAALPRVREKPARLDAALDALLIGVSSFFRDARVFETLERVVLPALQGRPGALRVLSAGCSHGQELYSIGILLDRAGLLDRASLVGVDCRPFAIAQAEAGVFDEAALSELPPRMRSRYFERVAGGYRAARSLRSRLRWSRADLTRSAPEGPWDLVLCRNLLIYLEPRAGEALLTRLVSGLIPGGYLVLGHAERPPAVLGLEAVARCVYRR